MLSGTSRESFRSVLAGFWGPLGSSRGPLGSLLGASRGPLGGLLEALWELLAPRLPKERPRGAQEAPRRRPRGAQEASKRPQEAPKRHPRGPQEPPRGLQEASLGLRWSKLSLKISTVRSILFSTQFSTRFSIFFVDFILYFGMVYGPLAHRDHLLRKKVRHAFRIVFYESKSMSELARATRKYQENSNEHKKNKLSKHTLRRYPQILHFFTFFVRFGVYFEAKIQ